MIWVAPWRIESTLQILTGASFHPAILFQRGFANERVKGVHHTSIINWVKQVGELLPNAYVPETIPLVGELDELETFVGSKKTKFGRQ